MCAYCAGTGDDYFMSAYCEMARSCAMMASRSIPTMCLSLFHRAVLHELVGQSHARHAGGPESVVGHVFQYGRAVPSGLRKRRS